MHDNLQQRLGSLSKQLERLQRSLGIWKAVNAKFYIDWALEQRRSMDATLADLRLSHQKNPTPALAKAIALLEAELEDREKRLKVVS